MGRPWRVPVIRRAITSAIADWLDEPEVLVLSGARQVGKTSIVYQLISRLLSERGVPPEDVYYLDLDQAGFADFVADSGAFLRFLDPARTRTGWVFLDEVQRLEEPGRLVKALHDLPIPLKFVLTGSYSLDIRRKTTEALTGRKKVFRVGQLDFAEFLHAVGSPSASVAIEESTERLHREELAHRLDEYATFGGYPAVVTTRDREKKLGRLEELRQSYLEKDIAGFLRVENLSAFRNLMTLLASQQGGLVNVQELSNTLGVDRKTVARYIGHLEDTYVVHRVPPFYRNPRTEISKMAKLFFADSGFRNLTLGLTSSVLIRTDAGAVLEGLVADALFRSCEPGGRVRYWRSKAGAEVDFVVGADAPQRAVEVKAGILRQPKLSRGYRSFLSRYRPAEAWLLNQNLWQDEPVEDVLLRFRPLAAFLARSPLRP